MVAWAGGLQNALCKLLDMSDALSDLIPDVQYYCVCDSCIRSTIGEGREVEVVDWSSFN